MTKKIEKFLAEQRPATPCLVMDLDVVADNYRRLHAAVPRAGIYYAVKANPAPEILKLLAKLGSSFDTASLNEIDMVLATGAKAERISYGNTIKKKTDIAAAHAARREALRLRFGSRARQDRRRGARFESVLPHPDLGRQRRLAAVAQVRLRRADGAQPAARRRQARRHPARRVVPCRLAAA